MARESFFHAETPKLLTILDEAARRSHVSRGQAFEDFLHMSVCSLSGGQLEEQYMKVVNKHAEGPKSKRGCDSLARLFGEMVSAMEDTRDGMKDVLGDLFQGAITYGEAGQFLTPESITRLMAQLQTADVEVEPDRRPTVCDPCCGSGRMLLAVAEQNRHWEFIGQDVDLRCVRMTAINLALRNLYGYVIHGNSLGLEKHLVYRTGFNLQGVIKEIPIESCPAPVQQSAAEPPKLESPPAQEPPESMPDHQLKLF